MKKLLIVFLLFVSVLILHHGCTNSIEPKLKVMVIIGGHSFDTIEFNEMLNSFPKYKMETVMQPRANQLIKDGKAATYDLLVFYDMWQDIDSATMAAYYKLLEEGKGMVFLHHALVSYQHWDDFKNIIGGKYVTETSETDTNDLSSYKHDLDLMIDVVRDDHPLTKDIENFSIRDEGYDNIWLKPDVMVLLKTNHEASSENIAWTNTYANSIIVYCMLGHDKNSYSNESFRLLLENSMAFVNKQK